MILDTNAVSAILAGNHAIEPLIARAAVLLMPVIVIGEYRYGLQRSTRAAQLAAALTQLIRSISVIPVDEPTATHYAELRKALRAAGTPLPENDIWIAALARQHQAPVLSRDTHFDLVPGVRRVGW